MSKKSLGTTGTESCHLNESGARKKGRVWDYKFCSTLYLAKKQKHQKNKSQAGLFNWMMFSNPLSLARVL